MKTLNKKQAQYEQIRKHGEDLNKIFNTGIEPIVLCKKLHRLEIKAHKLATDYCNGNNGVDTDNWESKCEPILKSVEKILGMDRKNAGFFVNGDCRGYALKIESDVVQENALDIHKDWGGYGIIAPEIN
jgi:hypothetical protein